MKSFKFNMMALSLILLICAGNIFGAGNIKGVVTDSLSGEPLYGTNVILVGTALGAASGFQGEFTITNISAGEYILRVSYIGYEKKDITLNVMDGKTIELEVELSQEVFEGEEVIITAQAQGQAAAINQQVNSNTIVNVVSKDKIESLPDANIAESIGRLPGVAIQRDAGEGSKVVVRGLSPRFSSITVNGQRIPATDPDNRSVDLSMISQDILQGIEVYKALTPDKDGDAIAGTVNLITKNAPDGFRITGKAQGGYNHLEDDYKQYKVSVDASNRFFNDKIGLVASGSAQRANRSSDVLDATYIGGTSSSPEIDIENLNLADIKEVRDRYSAGLNLDYKYTNGVLYWNNFYSRTERDQLRRRKRYRVDDRNIEYDSRDREIDTDLFSSTLGADYTLGAWSFDFQGAYSKSERRIPNSVYSRFRQNSAFSNDITTQDGPTVIPQYAEEDLNSTWFYYGTHNSEAVDDRDYTVEFNTKYSFNFSDKLNGYLKTGFKYRDKKRDRDEDEFRTDYGVTDSIGQAHSDIFDLYENEKILITNFIDESFDADEFLDGRYEFGPGLSDVLVNDFTETYKGSYSRNYFIDLTDYQAGEKITAAYLMGEFNLFGKLMILPGFRYEKTENDYVGRTGKLSGNLGGSGSIRDTIGGRDYSEILPMVHVKYAIVEGLDLRLAYTESISRPDYFNLVPFEQVNDAEQTLTRGNSELKHTEATNYDAYLSLYNKFGLFSIGGFYKDIKNVDYPYEYRETESGEYKGYYITEPVNSPSSKVYGFEFEAQANFRFLPDPFNGIVLSLNFTKIHSETEYPYLLSETEPDPPYNSITTDTFRIGRMPGQADKILNLTLGYERGGFSGRVSMVYQGEMLEVVGKRAELDGFTDSSTRFDFSASQKVWNGLSIYTNFNNITNIPEKAFLGTRQNATTEEYFGWTFDLGVKYSFE